jgi:hypothetical protein
MIRPGLPTRCNSIAQWLLNSDWNYSRPTAAGRFRTPACCRRFIFGRSEIRNRRAGIPARRDVRQERDAGHAYRRNRFGDLCGLGSPRPACRPARGHPARRDVRQERSTGPCLSSQAGSGISADWEVDWEVRAPRPARGHPARRDVQQQRDAVPCLSSQRVRASLRTRQRLPRCNNSLGTCNL